MERKTEKQQNNGIEKHCCLCTNNKLPGNIMAACEGGRCFLNCLAT